VRVPSGPVTPAIGRAVVPRADELPSGVDEVSPPVAARTILPARETGLFRRRAVPPVEPPAPQGPRHALPPTLRPTGAPMHSAPAHPVAPPLAPAPTPVRMPAPPLISPALSAAAPPAPAVAPVSAPAPASAPAAPVSLPARGARHEAPAPADVARELSPLAQLSQLASASYTPELVTPAESVPLPVQRTQSVAEPATPPVARPVAEPVAEPVALARRQPAAPAQPVRDIEEPGQPRPRAAGDVRSMLSGFRAGVQRGRDGAHTTRPGHGVDNLRRD
jgi:hypothetical protein